MEKVYWQFPSLDNLEQWKRLDKLTQKQVLWLYQPLDYAAFEKQSKAQVDALRDELEDEAALEALDKEPSEKDMELYKKQLAFAAQYNGPNQINLTDVMTNFVDLNSRQIWSDEALKEKKWEIKDNSSYFRVVKQGSVLVYLTFHIFTIFVILLSAMIRQSMISVGYVLILLPRMKDGAEVLQQRNLNQSRKQKELENDIAEITEDKEKAVAALEDQSLPEAEKAELKT